MSVYPSCYYLREKQVITTLVGVTGGDEHEPTLPQRWRRTASRSSIRLSLNSLLSLAANVSKPHHVYDSFASLKIFCGYLLYIYDCLYGSSCSVKWSSYSATYSACVAASILLRSMAMKLYELSALPAFVHSDWSLLQCKYFPDVYWIYRFGYKYFDCWAIQLVKRKKKA